MIIFSLTLLAYLLGSIPFGFLLSYFFNKPDPRINGSNNIGATNIARLNGWKLGLTTLILDVLKAFIPIKILLYYSSNLFTLFSLAIFFGHIFPIWLKFKGGKGVATYVGILFSINILLGVVFISCWIITFLISKYSSLSSIIASLSVPIYLLIKGNIGSVIFFIIMFVLIFFTSLFQATYPGHFCGSLFEEDRGSRMHGSWRSLSMRTGQSLLLASGGCPFERAFAASGLILSGVSFNIFPFASIGPDGAGVDQ